MTIEHVRAAANDDATYHLQVIDTRYKEAVAKYLTSLQK